MHFKGVNSKVPCRCCSLPATIGPGDTYYLVVALSAHHNQMEHYLKLKIRDNTKTKQEAAALGALHDKDMKTREQDRTGIVDEVSSPILSPYPNLTLFLVILLRLCYPRSALCHFRSRSRWI